MPATQGETDPHVSTSAHLDARLDADLPAFLEQQYERYDEEAHAVWRILFERRMATLRETGSGVFLAGMERIGLEPDRVPELGDVNRRLAASTGWAAVGVGGFIPAAQFFRCLARRRFPTTLIVRPRAQLDYLPEPDIFHDVFGHVPLHSDPVFADFLQRFGALAAGAESEAETTAMARLFWFTVEFGLIREAGRVRIYGSGLISSHGDAANALGPRCERRPFSLDAVLAQPFEIDHFQDVLFVVDSFEQLFDAVEQLRARRTAGDPGARLRAHVAGGARSRTSLAS
ncbi:MAG: phenylalanine 4-monooxygenase [Gemmatimonadaceae bacterium]